MTNSPIVEYSPDFYLSRNKSIRTLKLEINLLPVNVLAELYNLKLHVREQAFSASKSSRR